MKNTLLGLLGLVLIVGGFAFGAYIDNHYSMDCTVIEYKGEKCAKDALGEVWSDDRIESYNIGDEIKVTFEDNHTETRYDDVITRVR